MHDRQLTWFLGVVSAWKYHWYFAAPLALEINVQDQRWLRERIFIVLIEISQRDFQSDSI